MRPFLLFLLASIGGAQNSPITAVVSSADFKPGLATRSLGTVFGAGLADSEEKAATLPLPKKLANTRLLFCDSSLFIDRCQPLDLIYVSPTQINFVLLGPLTGSSQYRIFAEKNGMPSGSGDALRVSFPLSIESFWPRVFEMGYDCDFNPISRDPSPCGLSRTQLGPKQTLRGAVTDENGALLTSSNPARAGRHYTIWLTGLGPLTNGRIPEPLRISLVGLPQYNSNHSITTTVAPTYAGPSPQFPGLDQINFLLPTDLLGSSASFGGAANLRPCAEYRMELTLKIDRSVYSGPGPRSSNLVDLPTLVQNGDVPCL